MLSRELESGVTTIRREQFTAVMKFAVSECLVEGMGGGWQFVFKVAGVNYDILQISVSESISLN